MNTLQELYDSEINFIVPCVPDGSGRIVAPALAHDDLIHPLVRKNLLVADTEANS